MGILSNMLSAQIKNKVGAVVFRKVGGQIVASAYQKDVRDAKTPAQLTVRQKFAAAVLFYRTYANLLFITLRQHLANQSAYNLFMKLNSPGSFNSDGSLIYDNLKIAKGNMGGTELTAATASEATGIITLAWDGDAIPVGGAASDKLYALVANVTSGTFRTYENVAIRSADTIGIPVPNETQEGDTLKVYYTFVSDVTDAVSDSVISTVTVAA